MHECKPSGTWLGPLLGHCAHLARERLDARLTPYDVTPAQIHVVHYLYHHDNQAPQYDVTAHLKVKPSTANGILNRMEEKGLLRRTVSETDARKRMITLTEKGKERQEIFRQKFEETEKLMVSGLTEEETEQLYVLLCKVMNNLEEDRSL